MTNYCVLRHLTERLRWQNYLFILKATSFKYITQIKAKYTTFGINQQFCMHSLPRGIKNDLNGIVQYP